MATSQKTREEIELHKTVGQQYRIRYRFPFAAEFQQERNDIILDLLGGEENQLVLDLGCGTGVMIDALAQRFRFIVGLDASLEMISSVCTQPRMKCDTPVQLLLGDMEKLPLADRSVDLVVCRSALHHCASEPDVLGEIRRILRPGGRLVLAEPMNDNPMLRLARWLVRHGRSYGKIHTIDKAFIASQLRTLLLKAGFAVEREVRYGFLAYPLCDNPDLVPLLKHCPGREVIARGLRAVDRFLAGIPVVRLLSWYAILSAISADGRDRDRGEGLDP